MKKIKAGGPIKDFVATGQNVYFQVENQAELVLFSFQGSEEISLEDFKDKKKGIDRKISYLGKCKKMAGKLNSSVWYGNRSSCYR